jgi:hypothetical protein
MEEKDLLGDVVLVCIRGGSNHFVVRTLCAGTNDSIQKAIQVHSKRRIQRGYTLVA